MNAFDNCKIFCNIIGRIFSRGSIYVKYTLSDIDVIKKRLLSSPPLPPEKRIITLKTAVQKLEPALQNLLKKGYTYEQIHKILKENGFNISLNTLIKYSKEVKTHNVEPKRLKKTQKTNKRSISPLPALNKPIINKKESHFTIYDDSDDI